MIVWNKEPAREKEKQREISATERCITTDGNRNAIITSLSGMHEMRRSSNLCSAATSHHCTPPPNQSLVY